MRTKKIMLQQLRWVIICSIHLNCCYIFHINSKCSGKEVLSRSMVFSVDVECHVFVLMSHLLNYHRVTYIASSKSLLVVAYQSNLLAGVNEMTNSRPLITAIVSCPAGAVSDVCRNWDPDGKLEQRIPISDVFVCKWNREGYTIRMAVRAPSLLPSLRGADRVLFWWMGATIMFVDDRTSQGQGQLGSWSEFCVCCHSSHCGRKCEFAL